MKLLFANLFLVLHILAIPAMAQNSYELNKGWFGSPIEKVKDSGVKISQPGYSLKSWKPAVVPGTVLTTQLENKEIPDPFFGLNNEKIPDIFDTGNDFYTYWFVKDFTEQAKAGEQVYLHFRGVNYSFEVYLNGKKITQERPEGMFLRRSYNITEALQKNGSNRLAVIVFPPDVVGEANGGQGGDGRIAKNVAHQYVAGWDWIQPIRDRNTGIWDKVIIEKTGKVNLKNPHVITMVPGIRKPGESQNPALIRVSTELENATATAVTGTVSYTIAGKTVSKTVTVKANGTMEVDLPELNLENPKLWWPHGYGEAYLYPMDLKFVENGVVSDQETLQVGIREIKAETNAHTNSKQIFVNGQKIFIKGANWIVSDAMLRFTDARYDAEIRFHRDMNLNLIRIWGGALTERPEFYQACDQYGLLVMQDFWGSGDCNGRWLDPKKKDDQWVRRQYPDDHGLFLESAADQIKMIRNHASLAMWCGGNEITLPQDIMFPLRDSILPQLDGTRWFVDYSNSDDMSFNFLGGNGDGPYGIQPLDRFFSHRTWPFNSEIGSVGVGDAVSLKRFLPAENQVPPIYNPLTRKEKVDPVWAYHKYIGYEQHLQPYGKIADMEDFGRKAQLVNFDQYRSMMEGFTAHMWDWYTGMMIWKTQNPWTALRGQMYDYYLDPNACLYGLKSGSEPLHIFLNRADSTVMIANNSFEHAYDQMMVLTAYDMQGNATSLGQSFVEMGPTTVRPILSLSKAIKEKALKEGMFLSLRLLDLNKKVVSDNFYWLADGEGQYSGLSSMAPVKPVVETKLLAKGKVAVTLTNAKGNPVAFFNRLSIVNSDSKERLLPVFYEDNYVSLLPGESKTVVIEYPTTSSKRPVVALEGWNVSEQFIPIKD
ncbi:glycosyl hydrolase family 2 [Dyadobacter jejuensis]|uniref:Glycosyl hydrolase family 2 n=1 Tax=Dyadobacter jejuensis TaxID=1082580 RepID=A0A316AHM3_9BACT|nr:glycoside hydrolase family 2 TIM barrel-domain containing protein [Dyadobacter jejuensis]PWJ57206.1 glycosyl hydrolase family 2 [Dyadobacter jejuensis]